MIVCVLFVSNSWGCCLATPGEHRPVRRDNTRSCLIPIITWCHHFLHSYQYCAHSMQFKVWIESNHSLPCHVIKLSWWQVSQSPPPPVAKMRVPVVSGNWACEIELRQTGVFCFPWRQLRWSCGVFKSCISDAHCPFLWKWQVLHVYDISVLQQVCSFFQWDRLLDEGLASVQAGVPSCPDDAPLVHEVQMWRRRYKQIDPHWFQGSNAFLVNVINHIVEIFHNISGPTVKYCKFVTRALRPIFSSLLASACESQTTICDIQISLDIPWIGVNFICKEIYFLYIDHYLF